MTNVAATHATTAAEISLLAFCGASACFLPPFSARFLDSVPLVVLLGLAITCSLVLHLIFVAVLARSYGRSAGWYAALALITLPIGSIVGLILVEWHQKLSLASRANSQA